MRTASVRDLRLRFAEVAKWVEDGEEVSITRRGVTIATLTPPKPAPEPTKVDWAKRFKERPPVPRKKPLTAKQTAEFYESLKRDF